MKQIKLLLLAFVLTLCVSNIAFAGDFQGYQTVNMFIDGKVISSDVPPILLNDRTMVPIRVISESLNATVNYDPLTNNVIITTKGISSPQITPAKVTGEFMGFPKVGILVNGSVVTGDVSPIILNGRTLVPVRMVAQALGAKVDYTDGSVYIISGKTAVSTGDESVNLNDLSINEDSTDVDKYSTSEDGSDGLDWIDNDGNNMDQSLLDTNNL